MNKKTLLLKAILLHHPYGPRARTELLQVRRCVETHQTPVNSLCRVGSHHTQWEKSHSTLQTSSKAAGAAPGRRWLDERTPVHWKCPVTVTPQHSCIS